MADIFDVVADATRRDLLQVLLDRYVTSESDTGEISVGEIVDRMGLSQPTVSKHLKVLRDHGLVTVREEGQHRYYSIDTSPLEELEDWLIPFLSADFDNAAEEAASTVFAAWSGAQVPEPIRRAAAAASFQARTALQDASHEVERRVIDPIKKKLGRKDDK
jgi:ArsR family transcriptional regulator